jgi:hypothetical protein
MLSPDEPRETCHIRKRFNKFETFGVSNRFFFFFFCSFFTEKALAADWSDNIFYFYPFWEKILEIISNSICYFRRGQIQQHSVFSVTYGGPDKLACYLTQSWKGFSGTNALAFGPIHKLGRKWSVVNTVPGTTFWLERNSLSVIS